ncbi:MAG: RsmD family RNA methyltransferase [Acidobacteria bacterium]|nr:RsmD family RNA methyltransferase [Acidobacteriota bacterium]
MRYQLRIISGVLRGRKLTVAWDPDLRPMADRARAALFSILGDAVPGREFYDLFAGSGAVGLEALSRGASSVVFVEREPQAVAKIIRHLKEFGVAERARVLRADAYRFVDKGAVPSEPVNVFLGPPYRELERHFDAMSWLVGSLQQKMPPGSVLVLQLNRAFSADQLPEAERWDVRHYGRTQLAIWTKPAAGEKERNADYAD